MCFFSGFRRRTETILVHIRYDISNQRGFAFPFTANTTYSRDSYGKNPIDAVDGLVRSIKSRENCPCIDDMKIKFIHSKYGGRSWKKHTRKIKRVRDLYDIIRRTPSLSRA